VSALKFTADSVVGVELWSFFVHPPNKKVQVLQKATITVQVSSVANKCKWQLLWFVSSSRECATQWEKTNVQHQSSIQLTSFQPNPQFSPKYYPPNFDTVFPVGCYPW